MSSSPARGPTPSPAEHGLEQAGSEWFAPAERRRQLDELKSGSGFDSEMKYGTVGAVAHDVAGHVAAATSTGGLTAKRWGRIGDVAADRRPAHGRTTEACAVSCTGAGEYFIARGGRPRSRPACASPACPPSRRQPM